MVKIFSILNVISDICICANDGSKTLFTIAIATLIFSQIPSEPPGGGLENDPDLCCCCWCWCCTSARSLSNRLTSSFELHPWASSTVTWHPQKTAPKVPKNVCKTVAEHRLRCRQEEKRDFPIPLTPLSLSPWCQPRVPLWRATVTAFECLASWRSCRATDFLAFSRNFPRRQARSAAKWAVFPFPFSGAGDHVRYGKGAEWVPHEVLANTHTYKVHCRRHGLIWFGLSGADHARFTQFVTSLA